MYVRETIQLVSPQEGAATATSATTAIPLHTLLRSMSVGGSSQLLAGQPSPDVQEAAVAVGGQPRDSEVRNPIGEDGEGAAGGGGTCQEDDPSEGASKEDQSEGGAAAATSEALSPTKLGGILEAKVNEARSNRQSISHMSLDQVDRESIERFLSSLRQCKGVAGGAGEAVGGAAATGEVMVTLENDDLDDSARAESIVSLTSTTSNRSRDHRHREYGEEGEGDTHSTIRRQSVIIEGLTMETEELRKKVQNLEEELVSVPFVQEVQQKLQVVETKLEETESFCYQVVEENVSLKTEIEALEAEISEVQDTFREKDAKEFKRVKWELENLAKTCRNLQLKLTKAQSRANRLRQEKEQLEEVQTDSSFLRTTVVFAAALLAGIHILAGQNLISSKISFILI